jgi:hypothetical protein
LRSRIPGEELDRSRRDKRPLEDERHRLGLLDLLVPLTTAGLGGGRVGTASAVAARATRTRRLFTSMRAVPFQFARNPRISSASTPGHLKGGVLVPHHNVEPQPRT